MRLIWVLCVWWWGSAALYAQLPSTNLRQRTWVAPMPDTLQVDTLSVVPNSWVLLLPNRTAVDTAAYRLDLERAVLVWRSPQRPDTVVAQYRVFPFSWSRPTVHKEAKRIQSWQDDFAQYYQYQLKKQQEATEQVFGNDGGLEYNGSFGRSIAVGNNQDLTANSNFNLQISGKLTDEISITGAISDNNIPFQPDGNTQQIQDFDRIFVQMKYRQSALLLGDYDIKSLQNGYFMRYARRLQGAQLSHTQPLGKERSLTTWISGAAARGNYRRQTLATIEGNQGAYKLTGARNETFIMVLSASERVYLDGKLMVRGFDNDYIIDYNTAEIIFMPRRLITKDQRVVVEFQYADRSYLRATLAATAEYKSPQWTWQLQAISEQDAKNQALISGNITEQGRQLLANAGDSLRLAVVSSIDTATYKADNRIYYAAIDTVVAGVLYAQVLRYSTQAELAKFVATFSYVGKGNGFYDLASDNINGRIYQWLPPDSLGRLQGSYEPIAQLAAPRRTQLVSSYLAWQPNQYTKWSVDVAVSNNDINTFSERNNSDDTGIALATAAQHTISIKKNSNLNFHAQYEWAQRNFQTAEPYRNLEFARDWSTQPQTNQNLLNTNPTQNNSLKTDEHLAYVGAKLKTDALETGYQLALFIKPNNLYRGWSNEAKLLYKKNKWTAQAQCSYTQSTSQQTQARSAFVRPSLLLSRQIKIGKQRWTAGIKSEMEQNRLQHIDSTDLLPTAFYYHQTEIFAENKADTLTQYTTLRYRRRYDYAPVGSAFAVAAIADDLNISGAWNKKTSKQWEWTAAYRYLHLPDTTLRIPNLSTDSRAGRTFLAGLTNNRSVWKGLLRANIQYQIGTGRRQVTEIFFQQVDAGLGNYIWQDANNNGIKETGEFLSATANDLIFANYVQIILPTTRYQNTNVVQFNRSLNISPRALWSSNPRGIQRWLNYLSWQTIGQLRRETNTEQSRWFYFFPLNGIVPDSTLFTQNNSLRHTLFINQNQTKFEASVYKLSSVSQNYLVNGTDRRTRTEWGSKTKIALSTRFITDLPLAMGVNAAQSTAFTQQNFAIQYYSTEPTLSFTPNKNWRIALAFKYKYSRDTLADSSPPATVQQLTNECRYGRAGKRSINTRFSYAMVSYEGSTNSATAYNLLEGLQAGNNFLWTVSFDTQLSGNTQLNITYDGRKIGDSRINHVGRMGLRAVF